jgi:tRNA(fMet)-specific endonuclease VapC
MYLLDTDVLLNLLRRTPSTDLIARLASVPVPSQFTSTFSVAELVHAAFHVPERAASLITRLETSLFQDLAILPFDTDAARRYGVVRATLERDGVSVGETDLRIASIALSRGLTLITGSVGHFNRIPGLAVENWLVG